jgi:protein ImuB
VRDLALGWTRARSPWRPQRLFEASVDLDWEVADLTALGDVVAGLADRIAAALAGEDLEADRLEWTLRLCDRTLYEDVSTLAVPTRDPRALAGLVRRVLESRRPTAAVTGITLRAQAVRVARAQPSLTDPPRPSARTLAEVLSRLAVLVGAGRVGVPELLDTHRPDAMTLGSLRESPGSDRGPDAPGRGLTGRGLALRRLRPPTRAACGSQRGGRCTSARARSPGRWWPAWGRGAARGVVAGRRLALRRVGRGADDGTLCRTPCDGAAWFLEGVYD